MDSIPEDVMHIILSYSSIGDLDAILHPSIWSFDDDQRQELKRSRCSPITLFSELTSDSELMLKVMRDLKIVLSGSVAANYFCPSVCLESSDWDFYCTNTIKSVCSFWLYMSSLGVVWDYAVDSSEEGPYPVLFCILNGTLQRNKKTIKISLIWSSEMFSSPTYLISQFHSSMVMCFVSGHSAVSMYDHITSRKISLRWGTIKNNERRLEFTDSNQQGIDKYKDRGVTYIPYHEYFSMCKVKHKFDISLQDLYRVRSLNDDECTVVPFASYMTSDVDRDTSNRYIKNLQHTRFLEGPYHIIYIGAKTVNMEENRSDLTRIPITSNSYLRCHNTMYKRIADIDYLCHGIRRHMEPDRVTIVGSNVTGIPISDIAWNALVSCSDRRSFPQNAEVVPC